MALQLNRFNIDLAKRIAAYQQNVLKENKYIDVRGDVNNTIRGGSIKSDFVMPNGNVAPPDNFSIRGTLDMNGGKINRLNKAKKWASFSGDTARVGLDLVDKGLSIRDKYDPQIQAQNSIIKIAGGKVNRLKKATDWRDFSYDTTDMGLDLTDKGLGIREKYDSKAQAQKSLFKALGGAKPPTKAKINAAISKLEAYLSGSKLKPTKLQMDVLKNIGVIETTVGGMPKYATQPRTRPPPTEAQPTTGIVQRKPPPVPPSATSGGAKKAPGAWIQHVKAYAQNNGVSYKEAMTKAKASYKR